MQIYPAVISKDTEGKPKSYSLDDYVKVRIPHFHGPKNKDAYSNVDSVTFTEDIPKATTGDYSLPWARVNRSLDNRDFSAQDFNEDDLVYVGLENEDVNTPIILGFASRFQYTEDPEVALMNRTLGTDSSGYYGGDYGNQNFAYEDFTGANAVIRVAKTEANAGIHDDGNCRVKYNTEFYGREVSGPSYQWCAAFLWWCFKHANLLNYYCGGEHTASCERLLSYYKSKNQFIKTGFKAGDILFMNWNNGSSPQHVGLVIEDQKGDNGDVKTVEGNTSGSGSQKSGGHVMYKTRKMKFIVGGARLSVPKTESIASGNNESQIYKYMTEVAGFSKAGVCGLLANIEKESNFRPTASGDKGTSYGICQWHNSRFTNLRNFSKSNNLDYKTVLAQCKFLMYELTNNYKSLLSYMKNAENNQNSAGNVAEKWCREFERPANVNKVALDRANLAKKKYWPKYGG